MIGKIVIPVVAVAVGLYVIISILTSGGNAMSEAMVYLAILGFIISVANAKAGMMFVFLCANYLDLLKRFLVVDGSPTMTDVMRTLAVAPVAMGGIYIGLTIRSFSPNSQPLPVLRIVLALLISMTVVASSLTGGGEMKDVLQAIANSALYVGLLGFISVIYPTIEDQHKTWRVLVIIFLPVVIYGWVQLINGYNLIEMEYARSGLTMTVNPLLHPGEVEYKRIFSTMNSSPAYTLIGTTLSIYAIIYGFGKSLMKRFAGIIFAAICLSSHIPGAGRTGWAIAVCTIGCYFVFRSKILTILTYAISVTGCVLFLFNAEAIGLWLVDQTKEIGETEFGERATTMGTFTTRTQGIDEWFGNPRYFSWFGLDMKEIRASKVHDMIGYLYMTTGIIGISVAVITTSLVLFYLHKNLLAVTSPQTKRLGSFYLANVFALILSGVFSGSQFQVFPVNIYFWMMLGLLFHMIRDNLNFQKSAKLRNQTSASQPLAA